MSAVGYYNGLIGPIDTMQIPMNDRAVYFGDGCYEACFAVNGRLFRGAEHIDRFYGSLEGLRIPFPMSRERLQTEINRTVAASGEKSVLLYWQVTRGTDRRHHAFPAPDVQPNLLITATPKTADLEGAPMRLIIAPDIRYRMCHIKTLNLIPNILAIQGAKEAGADEAVLHRDGVVTEGSHTNIHILKDGVLYTHPADRDVLPGITRTVLLEICEHCGIPVSETPFTVDEMKRADEVLVTSSSLGINSVSSIDGMSVGGGAAETAAGIVSAYRIRFTEETGA